MAMQRYDVFIGDRLVEQVYHVAGTPAKDVRRGLIDHDGMPDNISVYRMAESRFAYDSVARATHPEEIS